MHILVDIRKTVALNFQRYVVIYKSLLFKRFLDEQKTRDLYRSPVTRAIA